MLEHIHDKVNQEHKHNWGKQDFYIPKFQSEEHAIEWAGLYRKDEHVIALLKYEKIQLLNTAETLLDMGRQYEADYLQNGQLFLIEEVLKEIVKDEIKTKEDIKVILFGIDKGRE